MDDLQSCRARSRRSHQVSQRALFNVNSTLIGSVVSLGINSQNSQRGSVNPKVYLAFIAIQAIGPAVALLLPAPNKVQRTDGLKVKLQVDTPIGQEIKETLKLFASKRVSRRPITATNRQLNGYSLGSSC